MASGVHDDPSDVDSPSSNKESSGDSVVTQATAPPSVMATAAAPKLDAPFKAAPFWSLYRYADRWDWLWMIFGFIGAIANGIMMPLFTIVFGDVLNSFGLNLFDPTALAASVNQQVPRFVYLGIGAFFASFIQTFFLVYPSVRQANRMRGTYLRTVLGQEAGFFDTDGTAGYLLQGLNEDCATVQAAIGEKVSMFAFMMATAIAGIVIAFTRGWDMSLVLMSLLPVLAITGFAVSVLVARLTVAMNRAYADANSLAQQALSNVRTVYAFNGQERTVTDYDAALVDPMKVGIKQGLYGGFTTGMANCVAYLGYSLAMWYGAKRVAAGAYTGGEVLNVLFAALIGGFALGQAVPNWQGFQSGSVSGGRLFSIMGRKPEIDAESPGQEPKEVQGTVELRNVVFAYPSRLDKPVFNGFNLIVPAGKTVALVGESGSGKSTVVSLIERFYDPQSGAVLLDGVDIRHLRLRWLRAQLGLVSQEPTLFGTTIKENILYGRPGASEEDVEAAARAANAATFISHLPLGYDTHVGEKGVQMSGGQKQRIAIARAILRNPAVLLLDEATSALDAESEHVVQDALDRLMVGRTTVVVAHRLSTVRDADCIAVVKQGAVVEQGTHDELIERAGVYATLVHMQYSDRRESLLGYEISNETHEGELGSLERLVSGIGRALMGTIQGREAGKSHLPVSVPVPRTSSTTLDLTEAGAVSHVKEQKEKGAEEEEITPVESEKGDESAPQLAGPPSRSRWLRWRGAKKKQKKANATSEEDGEKKRDEEEEGSEVPLGRLAALNRPETPALLGGLVGSIAMGMLMPAFSFAFSSLIGVFYLSLPSEIQSGARKWSLAFVGIGFGALIAAVIQSYCFNFMGQHLGKRVRVLMMRALLRQEIGWYDDEHNSSGVLTSKLSSDALAVKGQFGDTMALLTQNLVTLIAGYIIAGVYSWRMMLVVTATMPVMIAAVMIQSKLIIDYVSGERETFAAANATAAEAFSSARTVMAFGMEDQVTKLYDKQLEAPTRAARGRIVSAGVGFGFTQFSIFGIFSLAFWYAGVEVSNGTSSFTDVLKAFFAIFMAAFAASQSQLHFPDVAKGRAAAKRVFAVIDRTPAIDDSPSKGTRPTECRGEVELRDICFSYPQRQDAIVFENFNLTVPAGRTIALVGESGSGKSTIVSLIERFYDPQSGAVLLDGVDIRTLNLHWLRSQIGLVSQEPVLFNLTVADNIRYGRPLATLEEVVAAGKAANAHTFIEALPEGYHTKLGEGGIQLSGGQKQRVAIARAVVKDPRILLLDEATSALDAESERVVQEALDNLMKGRTTVVVAHRLSTVRDADSIAVVYKGRIVEQGTHTELIDKNGAYARLVAHQMRHHAL